MSISSACCFPYLSISIPQRNIEYGGVPKSAYRRFVLCIIINRSLRKSKHIETLKTDSCFESFIALRKNGSILNIGVEEKKVEHKSPKSCRIESSNLIFTGGVYALQGLYNKNTGYGTHEG